MDFIDAMAEKLLWQRHEYAFRRFQTISLREKLCLLVKMIVP
jgi:hypothetical protein